MNTETQSPHPVGSSALLAAARALCDKMRLIHDDPLYQAVWTCAWNHGVNYTHGPTYEHELKALEAAVKAANNVSATPVR
jgi:hypothetical protein